VARFCQQIPAPRNIFFTSAGSPDAILERRLGTPNPVLQQVGSLVELTKTCWVSKERNWARFTNSVLWRHCDVTSTTPGPGPGPGLISTGSRQTRGFLKGIWNNTAFVHRGRRKINTEWKLLVVALKTWILDNCVQIPVTFSLSLFLSFPLQPLNTIISTRRWWPRTIGW